MLAARRDALSSTRCTTTSSGSELRVCNSSWSVVVLGISRPFLLPATAGARQIAGQSAPQWQAAPASGSNQATPRSSQRQPRGRERGGEARSERRDAPAHMRPMIRVPAIDVRTIGIVSASSDSNTL